MTKSRRAHSAKFKAKVALEAVKGEETMAQLSARFGIHPTQIQKWKKELLDGASDIFSTKPSRVDKMQDTKVRHLHEKIGELTVERDFLSRALDG